MSRGPGYRETQSATVVRVALVGSILLILVLAAVLPMPWFARVAMVLVAVFEALLAWNLWSMTIEVIQGVVRVSFGPGFFHRSYPVAKIVSAKAVEIAWYGGYGVHVGIGATSMIVSGRAAVQLELEGGRRILLGCARPSRLIEAIELERARA